MTAVHPASTDKEIAVITAADENALFIFTSIVTMLDTLTLKRFNQTP
jgi:hypothetical protein